ncbi:RNase adapter protein [Frankliniella fusca]|uniref:RNase adapter protein n=1 Tax=Frankliniella fusca TaxID=407009 RepID=A0AAE1HK73_9NEOP|nr:RNase adapter protein [Frankliniella fusca]
MNRPASKDQGQRDKRREQAKLNFITSAKIAENPFRSSPASKRPMKLNFSRNFTPLKIAKLDLGVKKTVMKRVPRHAGFLHFMYRTRTHESCILPCRKYLHEEYRAKKRACTVYTSKDIYGANKK